MDPLIRYAVISNRAQGQPQFLCEFQVHGCTVNAPDVTRTVLKDVKTHDHKASYAVGDDYLYHYIAHDGVVYSCIADKDLERRVPFLFLDTVKASFAGKYRAQWQSVLESKDMRGYNSELKKEVEKSNRGDGDTIRKVHQQTDEVQSKLADNLDKVIQRGEKVTDLMDNTNVLDKQAGRFKSKATTLNSRMQSRKIKMIIFVVFLVLLIGWVISVVICGFDYSKCGSKTPAPSPPPK
eukprot:TRINITY_DN1631_c0_g3_i1.p1 TRINITY_DN1631_c0_g3~~TRINITY_DN1631_c0_g3_i1.p1  ORF type:complete len:237 (+),score=109.27 TRINITY_DN1631_c0_g3_i1:62-772(+)